jgi:hypothetical protein
VTESLTDCWQQHRGRVPRFASQPSLREDVGQSTMEGAPAALKERHQPHSAIQPERRIWKQKKTSLPVVVKCKPVSTPKVQYVDCFLFLSPYSLD